MKKTSKILFTILIVILAVVAVACDDTVKVGEEDVKIEYSKIEQITVDEASIAEGFMLADFDISKIILNVKYFDTEGATGDKVAGEVIPMPATMKMVKAEDQAKLRVAGEKEITLIYGKFVIPVKFTLIDAAVNRYSVMFLDAEGNRVGDIKYVSAGGRVTPPAMETPADSIFVGWRDRATGSISTLDNINVNLVLEAVYELKNYSVEFYTKINGTETLITTVSIPNGARVLDYAPVIPIQLGYSNGRWENVNSMGVVDKNNLKFYAIYDRDQVQVGFKYKRYGEADGIYYNSYDVGSVVPNPPPAECVGYKFVEWRIGDKKAEFPYNVTVEVEFEAKYIRIADGNDGLGYTATTGGLEITSYTGEEDIVVIPEKHMGLDVVSIRDGVFKDKDIAEFTVSNSNRYFIAENGVLFNVDKTKLIAYPNLKTDIENYTLSASVKEIGAYAFYRSEIKSVVFNEALAEIGAYAFADCDELSVIAITSGVTKIGESAFESTTGKSAVVGINFDDASALEEIGAHAFKGLVNLQSVSLPIALTTLGKGAFAECKSLTSVAAIDNKSFVVDRNGMLLSSDRRTLYLYPAMYSDSIDPYFTLGAECERIEEGAFSYARMSGIIIQSAVTIEDHAFDCPNLLSLTITPNGSVSAKKSSFDSKIPEAIYIDESNASFDALKTEFNDTTEFFSYSSFERGSEYHDGFIYEVYEYNEEIDGGTRLMRGVKILGLRLTESVVNIPSTIGNYPVTAIGANAFEGDNFIEELTLPTELRTIEARAFYGMTKLSRVYLNNVLAEIGESAFAECENLASVVFTDELNSIASFGRGVFSGTPYEKASANDFLTVGNALVEYKGFSETVRVSAEISLIAPGAFMGRGEITQIVFEGNNLKYIEKDAFMYCVGLTTIEFPSSLRQIRTEAFSYCDNIKKVKFRVSKDDVSLSVASDAFGTNRSIKFEYTDTELFTLHFHTDDNTSDRSTGLIFTEAVAVETRAGYVFGGWYHEGEAAGANAYTNLVNFPFDPTDEKLADIIGTKDDPNKMQFNVYAKWIEAEGNATGTSGIVYGQTDGGYAVTGYVGTEKYVIIPSVFKNKPVVSIADNAFSSDAGKAVRYITLPHSRSSDGSWSSDLSEIGENALDDTDWYKNTYGDFVIIDDFLIKYKGTSKTVVIPEKVKKIAKGAFKGNLNIEKVVFCKDLGIIAANAFSDCVNLKEVELPENVYSIEEGAFKNCRNLEKINFEACTILNSVRSDSFEGTKWLADYVGSCVMINSILYRYNGSAKSLHIFNGVTQIGERAFSSNQTLMYVFIPQSVVKIGDSAFEMDYDKESGYARPQNNLQSVNIYAGGSELVQIGDRAFYECRTLSFIDLTLANKLSYIGEYAFGYTKSLKSVNIPASVDNLKEGAFGNSGLNYVVFAAGSKLEKIGSYAFSDNASLFSVKFIGASELKEIGDSAFENCRMMQSFVNQMAKVESFGERAFYNCDNLTDFDIDESALNEIGDDALGSDSDKKYIGTVGQDNMAVIGNILVKYNGFDTVIHIPTNVTTIYNRAFAENMQITDVVFNWKMDENGEITEPSNIRTINAEAFDGCANLKNIDFPNTITYVGNNALRGTRWYEDRDTTEFVVVSNTLIKYNGVTAKQVIMPDEVEVISAGAFAGSPVYDVVIGENIKRIEKGAFDGIVADEDFGKWTITLKAEIPPEFDIDSELAAKLDELKCETVFAPSASVLDTYRLNDSWSYLSERMEVITQFPLTFDVGTVGEELEGVSAYALYEEPSVTVKDPNYVFAGWYTDDGQRVTYPYILEAEIVLYAQYTSLDMGSSSEAYKMEKDKESGLFTIQLYTDRNSTKLVVISKLSDSEIVGKIGHDFLEDPNGTFIKEGDNYIENAEGAQGSAKYKMKGAYEGHNEITEVTFANNSQISVIGDSAFKNCKGMKRIVLPAGVKRIEKGAFYGCDRLEEVVFSDDATDVVIEGGAFENCKSLRKLTLPAGVTDMGDGAFRGCVNLTDITLKSSKPIRLTVAEGEPDKRPFEIIDGMVIRVPNKSKSGYEVYWKEYANYLKEEAQDAENENE